MADLLEINAEWRSIERAKLGDFSLLLERLQNNLSTASERNLIAAIVDGTFKRKRGRKANSTTKLNHIELYRMFVWLRDIDKWSKKETALYEKIADITLSKSGESIRKLCATAKSTKRSGYEKIDDEQFKKAILLFKCGIFNKADIVSYKPTALFGIKL